MEKGPSNDAGASAGTCCTGPSVLTAQLKRFASRTHSLPNPDWLYGRHLPFCSSTFFMAAFPMTLDTDWAFPVSPTVLGKKEVDRKTSHK